MSPRHPAADPPAAAAPLPPLVLRCRPIWRWIYPLASVVLIALGTGLVARDDDARSAGALAGAAALLLAGTGCAWFTVRHALARVILDEAGLRLRGPLGEERVAWEDVVRWERLPARGGFGALRIVHGEERRRLSIPLIYEDAHVLEMALAARAFPSY